MSSSSSSSSAATVVSKLTKLLGSSEDDSFSPQSTLMRKHSIIYAITLKGWNECAGIWDLSDEWDFISKKHYAVVKKIILDEVIAYCQHLRRRNFDNNHPLFHHDPKFFPRIFNQLDHRIIFDLVLECIRYCYSSVVKGRGLCSDFDTLSHTLTMLALVPILEPRVTKSSGFIDLRSNYMDAEAKVFPFEDLSVHQSLIDTFVSRTDSYMEKLKLTRPPINDLAQDTSSSSPSPSATTIVEKLIKLLRREEDDSFRPQNTNMKKCCIIDAITLVDWTECDGIWDLSKEWDSISQKHLGLVKIIILNEVIAYCRHLGRCSFDKNQPLFHDDPNFFPRSLNDLDDQIIFDLISECIRYCYSSAVKGRGLCPEFNILLNTLTLFARIRNVQTNVSCNLMNDEAKFFPFAEVYGHQSLIDTLVSRTDSYQAHLEQRKLKNCRQPINDLDEGMTMNLEEHRKDRDLNPINPELLSFPKPSH